MHLFIFKAESCGHRSAFNDLKKKNLYVFISVYVHVTYCIMCVSAVCTVVCGGVQANVHVCFWIKSKTLPIYIRTAKGKSRDVLRVLLCVVGVFCHTLMLLT